MIVTKWDTAAWFPGDTLRQPGLYKFRLDGSGLTRLTFPGESLDVVVPPGLALTRGTPSGPRWSPKGRYVIYLESLGRDNSFVAFMDTETGRKKTLTGPFAYDLDPQWSPSGRYVLYLRSLAALWLTDTAGVKTPLPQIRGWRSFLFQGDSVALGYNSAQWAEDDEHLLVPGTRWHPPAGPETRLQQEIFKVSLADGSPVAQVTTGNRGLGGLVSPDGALMIWRRGTAPFQGSLFLLGMQDTSLVPLTSGPGDGNPHWANDSRTFIFLKAQGASHDTVYHVYFGNVTVAGQERLLLARSVRDADLYLP
ncbi:MAG: PD40 domain-containing protein [Candidatus Eisenbacteria bacterium]|nr:PD40 domain-containing protein [Candidatus Eisenbacteria bacterium]